MKHQEMVLTGKIEFNLKICFLIHVHVFIKANDQACCKYFSDYYYLMSEMKNWFCFIKETETGKVTSVSYPDGEEEDVVNFKKSIASAFQVNLRESVEEEEIDSQSHHISHYRYLHVHRYIHTYVHTYNVPKL